jgi:hypothetical protein
MLTTAWQTVSSIPKQPKARPTKIQIEADTEAKQFTE